MRCVLASPAPVLAPAPAAMSRRTLLVGLSFAALSVALPPVLQRAVAQRKSGPEQVPVEELMKPGELPDLALGPADAKVVVVEYA